MNDFDGCEEAVSVSTGGRKRKLDKASHGREKQKRFRHGGGGKFPIIACRHTAALNKKLCHADKLTANDLHDNFSKFYECGDKTVQDRALLQLLTITKVHRRRKKVENQHYRKERDIAVQYSLLAAGHPDRVPVCKATFISVLGVSKDRVSRVARYYAQKAAARPEGRGGARKVDENSKKRKLITEHIQTFTCRASHYGRRGAPGRKYLPSDLSVRKMHQLFEEQHHAHTSYSLYYSIFSSKFNLGFGHPATDACSVCSKHRLMTKDPNLTDSERRIETASFILHRRRARVFYDLLGIVDEDAVTVCFDMMQNIVLPKTPVGQAYYSRQLYLYVFGVVRHYGKDSRQNKDDVHLYVWSENQNRKDSNMIASALHHCFRDKLNCFISHKKRLRLFSDSCFGQNKNMHVVSMLLAMRNLFPGLKIEYTFPIRGHSFLPADRVFGRIEQSIRKVETILLPNQYYSILNQFGNVHIYGDHWESYDFRSATQHCVKAKKTFKISEARMLELNSEKVGFKSTYSGEFCYHSVLKRGKNWKDFVPCLLPMETTVTDAKRNDVTALLTAIGAPEEVLTFYNDALSNTSNTNPDSVDSSAEE